MSPLTKMNGGLSGMHSADEDAVSCLVGDAHEKKKNGILSLCILGLWKM